MIICPLNSYVTGYIQLCLNNNFAMRNNISFLLFIYDVGLGHEIEWSWVIGNICESVYSFIVLKNLCLVMPKEGILAYIINS